VAKLNEVHPMPKLPSATPPSREMEVLSRGISLTTMIVIVAVATILHLGQEVFLPLAMAVLLTFALTPVVSFLRSKGLPHIVSVLATVFVAFIVIGLFLLLSGLQIGVLVRELPSFQVNILQKLDSFKESGNGTGLVSQLTEVFTSINAEISNAATQFDGSGLATATPNLPMPVEVIERRNVVQVLYALVVPLIRPIATTGLVVVVIIFMLLEREEIRDRFIRLLGARDLHRTTQVLEEAGGRVGTYLLIQLVVNTIYAILIGIGLWLIGVPNALLWGLLTLVFRFVPFIGSFLAAVFPLFLAFAVSPGWSAVLWTAALFLVVELITSNVIEPWLYGSRTGVSPLAIIICAIFWTYIWGPLGLVLSTPLTVCLVVLGRHLPQFELFDILFGDKPVLAQHARLYQRLLAGDPTESTFKAEEALEEMFLAEYYRDIGIPALLLGQDDLKSGLLTPEQENRLALSAGLFVADLSAIVTSELNEAEKIALNHESEALKNGSESVPSTDPNADGRDLLPILESPKLEGKGFSILSIGGRSKLDDVAAIMLAQTMAAEGAEALALSYIDLTASRFQAIISTQAQCVILNFLDASPSRASLFHIRRIKRSAPQLRVGVVIWQMPDILLTDESSLHAQISRVSKEKIAEVIEIGSDFVVTNVEDALNAAFQNDPPKPPTSTPQKSRKRLLDA